MSEITAKFKLEPNNIKAKFMLLVVPSSVSKLKNDSGYLTQTDLSAYALQSEVDNFKQSETDEISEIIQLMTERTESMINLNED